MLLEKKTEYGRNYWRSIGVHGLYRETTSELTIDRDMEITTVIVMIVQIRLTPPEILSKYHYDL